MSANNVFLKGQVARLSLTTKENTELKDPSSLLLKIKVNSIITTYTDSTNPSIVKDAVGLYHLDLDLETVGTHYFRWEGSGLTNGAGEGVFLVKESSLI